jgi:hypothetical protein
MASVVFSRPRTDAEGWVLSEHFVTIKIKTHFESHSRPGRRRER